MTGISVRSGVRLGDRAGSPGRAIGVLVLAGILVYVTLEITRRYPSASTVGAFSVALIAAGAIYLITCPRLEVTLSILMLYIGCADGYLKLRSGSSIATLGRDALLYGIVVGVLVRKIARKEQIEFPPWTAWIVAFLLVVIVQITNPSSGGYSHSLPSLRPHLEFIPLFFLGYWIMRTTRRLRGFLILLLIVGAANGIVGAVQFNMTPAQLASWGPGYATRINGGNGIGARVFLTSGGTVRVRPFALGSDIGFGGEVGVLAAPAGLALLALSSRRSLRALAALLMAGVVLAVVTSQARVSILGIVVAVLAFIALASQARRLFSILVTLILTIAIGGAVIAAVSSSGGSGAFQRYSTITPSHLLSTASQGRGGSILQIPVLIRRFPLGAGLGSGGPAAGYGGKGGTTGVDAENQFDYLIIELGLPGLLTMLALNCKILFRGLPRVRRIRDHEVRLALAALAAGFVAMFLTWPFGVTTANTPGSPFFWFVAGTFAYWLFGSQWRSRLPRSSLRPKA